MPTTRIDLLCSLLPKKLGKPLLFCWLIINIFVGYAPHYVTEWIPDDVMKVLNYIALNTESSKEVDMEGNEK